MTKKDEEDFNDSTNCQICVNAYVDGDIKVRDHCYLARKYIISAGRDCNIKVKLNHKNFCRISQTKKVDSHLTMQELGKSNFKINVIPNGLEKCTSFNIISKLAFIYRF